MGAYETRYFQLPKLNVVGSIPITRSTGRLAKSAGTIP
mgnify:CR=1 FL=1